MRNFIVALMSFISITSFASSEGVINLSSELDYNRGRSERRAVEGRYRAKLKVSSKKLTLRFQDQKGERHKIAMSIPKHSFPREGQFRYESLTIGQPFSIFGSVSTRHERSESRTRLESCTIERPVRSCRTLPDGRRQCRIRYVTINGDRVVHYHIQTVHQVVSLNLDQDLASFRGRNSNSRVIYEHTGACRPR